MKKAAVFADLLDTVKDACFENADGCAKARRTLIGTGWISTLTSAVTAGTFLSVLMLAIGADDVFIGYCTMAETLSALIQIISPLIWERIPRRKPFIVANGFLTTFLSYGVITAIPFLSIGSKGKLGLFFAVKIICGLLNGFVAPAVNAYQTQSIPLIKRVNYTSVSTMVSTIINIVSTFLAGVFLDSCESKAFSYASLSPALSAIVILRVIALVLSILIWILYIPFVKEYPYDVKSGEDRKKGLSLLIKPLRDKPYLLTIIIPCLWTFTGQIIGNFFSLHLIENIRMSYTMISSANLITTPMVLLLTPVWTIILKKHSWVKTLSFAIFGYCGAWLCNVFISAETQYMYFIAIIAGQLFNPCVQMVNGNLVYLKLPEEDRTVYFSFYAIATTVCTFLGQTVGTMFVKWTPDLHLTWFGVSVCNLQLTSFIAAVLGLGLAVYTYFYSRAIDREKQTAPKY